MELTVITHESDNSISTLTDREQHQTLNNNWSTGIQKIRRHGKLTNIRIHSVSLKYINKSLKEVHPVCSSLSDNQRINDFEDMKICFCQSSRPKGFQWVLKKQLILARIILTIDLTEDTSVRIRVSRLWTRPVAPDVNTKTKTEVSIKTRRIVKD